MQRKISYQSFDFDGCLFHPDYCRSKSENRLIECNENFFKEVCNEINDNHYNQVITIIGSNRQSNDIDQANITYLKPSCFPAFIQLTDYLKEKCNNINCEADKYLLADTYGDKEHGENFTKSLEGNWKYDFSHWIFDEEKFSLLYTQTHRAAANNPDAEIVFNFYDDRCGGDRDILNELSNFYKANPDLLAKNITLRLHHYNGNEVKKIAEIKGQGEIDFNYEKNLKLMATCTGHTLPGKNYDYKYKHFMKDLTANNNKNLNIFKNDRKLTLETLNIVKDASLETPTIVKDAASALLFTPVTTNNKIVTTENTQEVSNRINI